MSAREPAIFERARGYGDALALTDPEGEYTYRDLTLAAERAAAALLDGRPSLAGGRVAFLVEPGFDYVATLWGTWRAGGVAVPLALAHPPPELAYVLDDCDAEVAVAGEDLAERLRPLARERGLRLLTPAELLAAEPEALPRVTLDDPALIIYTSGTTGRPKGAVLTHGAIEAQLESLVAAWGWSRDDRILEVLPLHHVHGLVNVLTCALYAGAVCDVLPRFDAAEVWRRILSGRLTLLMAVPTIWIRLVRAWEEAPPDERRRMSEAARRLRLTVSGSAALPAAALERWREISGHVLLERYGMTEIGMALSNPLRGERVAGAVGGPMPGVEVRLVDDEGNPVADGRPGEIEVRGPTLFREYWNRPEATRAAFRDGWFQTGDMAVREGGVYRILGRSSVDILKSGGEKISALEIEAVLLEHPAVRECAVVGLPDPEWGQRITAAVVPEPGARLDLETLRDWARDRLAVYKLPRELHLLDELPRNPLGKVTKPELAERLAPHQ